MDLRGNKYTKLVLLAIGCVLLFGLNYPSHAENAANESLGNKINQIIHYGSLAPSSHNAQMWQVKKIAPDKLGILIDRRHTLTQVDPEDREALISLGAFIENMVQAAPYYDLQAKVNLIARNSQEPEIAEVTFAPQNSPVLPKDGLDNIKNRHTVRTAYLSQKLRESDSPWINNLGTEFRYFPLSAKEGTAIGTAIVQATKQQAASDNKQKELAGMFRFKKKDVEQTKDGLTPDGMGLTGIVKWFVTTFFTRNTVMSKSFRKQTVAMAERQAKKCSGFVIITSADNSAAALVNTGRSLEKFLIQAAGRKLAVQPMSAPLEESPWKETMARQIGVEQTVQMILRVGYVKDYGQPVSKRREVLIAQ